MTSPVALYLPLWYIPKEVESVLDALVGLVLVGLGQVVVVQLSHANLLILFIVQLSHANLLKLIIVQLSHANLLILIIVQLSHAIYLY